MTRDGEHFEDQAWIDFSLQLLPGHQAAKMQTHLDSGCVACAQISRLWGTVVELAAREHQYGPPESLVEDVKAAFPLIQKISELPYLAQPAQMIVDSYAGSFPAGLRGRRAAARRLQYEMDDFVIDLLLGCEPEDRRLALTGQIARRSGAKPGSPDAKILVTGDGGEPLRHTVANSLGEFHVDMEEQKMVTLYIELPGSIIASIVLSAEDSLEEFK